MFFAKFVLNGQEHAELYTDPDKFYDDISDSSVQIISFVNFSIFGKDYKSRKNWLYDVAVKWSNCDSEGLYLDELCDIDAWFSQMGKRYGLLREFKENCICY